MKKFGNSRIYIQGKKFVARMVGGRIKRNALQALPFWLASLFTGLIAVLYTRLFVASENLLHQILEWHNWLIFVITPTSFFFAWFIVQRLAPNARGSGIPQVMAAIELATPEHDRAVNKLLSLRIVITKILSSLLMILGGGAIGREGPTIQVAGSVFRTVDRFIPITWPRLSRQYFILTGAAAGLAAAFNTPLGGIVFAVEELARIHIRYFRTALFTAVIIAGLTAQGLLGPYLYLGYPDVQNLRFSIFFGVVITAIFAGLAGALMSKAILAVMRWKKNFSKPQTILFILGAGLIVATTAFFFNEQVLGSGKDIMNKTLFSQEKYVSWHTMLLRIGGPVVSFNTGAAGGVFAPSLAAGASIGSWIASLGHVFDSNANILILSGMVAFLTGVTRTPFTSAILVLEMTDRHSVIFHLMLAAMLANIAALVIDRHSFYEKLKDDYIKDGLSALEVKSEK